MAHDVFICYAKQDRDRAEAICDALEARGMQCWIAPRDVPPGVDYAEAIIDAIAASGVMVLVFSSHANASRHVRREMESAATSDVPVIPFKIEDVPATGGMRYYIDSIHCLDAFAPPLEQHLESLVSAVQRLPKEEISDVPPAVHPGPPPQVVPTEPPPAEPEVAVSPRVARAKPPRRRRFDRSLIVKLGIVLLIALVLAIGGPLALLGIGLLVALISWLVARRGKLRDFMRSRRRLLLSGAGIALIIAMVAGIPYYRAAAGARGCLANVQNLALAAQMYLSDHNDRFMLADNWVAALDEYVRDRHVFHCPADDWWSPDGYYSGWSSYGMNAVLSGRHASELEYPWDVVVFYETEDPGENPVGDFDDVIVIRRHGNDISYAYADGTARSHPYRLRSDFEDPGLQSQDVESVLEEPSDADAYVTRGNNYFNRGEYEQALAAYNQAIALDQNYAIAHYDRAACLDHLGRYREALEAYDRAIELDADFAAAHGNRVGTLNELGRYQEALAASDTAIALDPSSAVGYTNRGVALAGLAGREEGENKRRLYEQAVAAFSQAIELDASYTYAHNNKGWTLQKLGRNEEALEAYEQALELDPGFATARTNRANLLKKLGRPE